MKIGCPTEIKPQEFRVGLMPTAAQEAVANGHEVVVQSGAGAGNGTGTGGVLQYLARLTLSQPTPKSLFEARALTDLGLPKVEMPYPLPTAPIFLTSER